METGVYLDRHHNHIFIMHAKRCSASPLMGEKNAHKFVNSVKQNTVYHDITYRLPKNDLLNIYSLGANFVMILFRRLY